MKTIANFINEASKNKFGELHYAMPFKAFKKWLESVDKKDEFQTVALVDTDMDITEIEDSQYAKTYYDETKNAWVSGIDYDILLVSEWTVADTDIILVYEK